MLTIWPVGHGRVEALEEADVLVGDEHVHEPAQLAVLVVQPLGEAGVARLERLEHLGDGLALERDLGRAAGELAQLRRDPNGDGHWLGLLYSSIWLGVERLVEGVERRG